MTDEDAGCYTSASQFLIQIRVSKMARSVQRRRDIAGKGTASTAKRSKKKRSTTTSATGQSSWLTKGIIGYCALFASMAGIIDGRRLGQPSIASALPGPSSPLRMANRPTRAPALPQVEKLFPNQAANRTRSLIEKFDPFIPLGIDLQIAENGIVELATGTPTPDQINIATARLRNALQPIMNKDATGIPMRNPAGWLEVQGNQLLLDGSPFRAHGVNIYDSTLNGLSCAGASYYSDAPLATVESLRAAEVIRRANDALLWGSNYIRLLLDTRPITQPPGSVATTLPSGLGYYDQPAISRVLTDPDYWQSVVSIVNAITNVSGTVVGDSIFVDISLFSDTSATMQCNYGQNNSTTGGTPTPESLSIWAKIVSEFATNPNVIFSLGNEPRNCQDVPTLTATSSNITAIIQGIRQYEKQNGAAGEHIIKVPSLIYTGLCCSRDLSWWAQNPLTATNVIYSAHWYEPFQQAQGEYIPYRQLPVIVDETAPMLQGMSISDIFHLLGYFESITPPVSYASWIYSNNQAGASAGGDTTNGSLLATPAGDEEPPSGSPENNACELNIPLTLTSTWGLPMMHWIAGAAQAFYNRAPRG